VRGWAAVYVLLCGCEQQFSQFSSSCSKNEIQFDCRCTKQIQNSNPMIESCSNDISGT